MKHCQDASSMVSKTRERLIEVARQLFARKGVENTTMLDIANASDKGRRTIYTYFKNKREIHQAVIERESDQAVAREREILNGAHTAREKLEMILRTRFETLLCPASQKHTDSLPLLNLLEGSRVGKIRRLTALKEIQILTDIVEEGVRNGEFIPERAAHVVPLVVMMMGVDNTAATTEIGVLGVSREETFEHAVKFILDGLTGRCGDMDNKTCKQDYNQ